LVKRVSHPFQCCPSLLLVYQTRLWPLSQTGKCAPSPVSIRHGGEESREPGLPPSSHSGRWRHRRGSTPCLDIATPKLLSQRWLSSGRLVLRCTALRASAGRALSRHLPGQGCDASHAAQGVMDCLTGCRLSTAPLSPRGRQRLVLPCRRVSATSSLDLSPRARGRHTDNSAVRRELGESRRESHIALWVT